MYTGYWSFESGTLVKILSLDDGSCKELQYYPYDLVHWED
ncbi:PoNe immunity protein domain-containing protein [Sphingobacterium sp. ML3W]